MRKRYIKPHYFNNCNIVFPLQRDFNDTRLKWIELKYLITEDFYEDRPIGLILDKNLLSRHGDPIFENRKHLFSDGREYHLLNQDPQPFGVPKTFVVSEVWGYCPSGDFVIERGTKVPWVRPGLEDDIRPGASNRYISDRTISADRSTQTLTVESTVGFQQGDLVRCSTELIYWLGAPWWPGSSNPIPIISLTPTQITVTTDFTWHNAEGGTLDGFTWWTEHPGKKFIEPFAAVRPPLSSEFAAIERITFFSRSPGDFIAPTEPFQVVSGNESVDVITKSTTSPNTATYKEWIAGGKMLNRSQSLPTQLLGDVWMRSEITLPAQ